MNTRNDRLHRACVRVLMPVLASAALLLAGCTDDGAAPSGTSGADIPRPGTAAVPDLSPLQQTLAALEHRKTLVHDANDIKRLQRSYGYYLDRAHWDEMVDLFADDATIEIGLDGVYIGKDRIREYLYALGDGRLGLSVGQLNEHMQLMPVVTVAPDGQTAKGRWRAIIMAGQLGESAFWAEGPYENEYIKEDGRWKLNKVHWFQSIAVPYEGGWQVNEDINGGIWVSDRLPPDQPPSVSYDTWPGTFLPPFHFPNPVLGAEPVDPGSFADESIFADRSLPELAERAAVLAQEIQLLEDENEIENLQRIYGFYTDKGFWSEAAELFADDGTIEVGLSGIYQGRDRVRAFLRTQGEEYPQEGRLFDQMQLQPVVHVAPDGRTAKARWRLFAQEAVFGEYARWGVGIFENEYVKEGGRWKIQSLHAFPTMYTPYEDGWGKTALPLAGPAEASPPDRPTSVEYAAYPAVAELPFHYENPVTGRAVYAEMPADYAEAPLGSADALAAQLTALEQRLVRLEDFDSLERLNAVYGYYLARNEWDNLTGIFAPDGEIEIAMRGVYAGSASVRRNLDLYGEAGIHHGLLHNHMQYQPVIHIAEDGQSANMRSRAFSIMGQYEAYSMWMGGVYENIYVKRDGIWQILRDQVFNTYFAQYAGGWKDLSRRTPPGLSDTNPPDSPPTVSFEMYPSAFLVPFHYANPATGNVVTWSPPE